ncbi:sarcosine oxidase subunit delta [Litoreibacter albidus]|uniref:Sarcosine oxidase subunit delta n=1 Tax=Litoreibacter albidus TaxID=670155 RepID=A0A1H2RHD6_9RHOB|nr:sarcosine oxidase subunit delta [Litoreibacter albidus]SDW18866.1 sarcosine oxidase subunit delta [Litoreibacter albidus]
MRINCPICGDRDRREFYYLGAADYLNRPAEGDLDGIHKYLHIRENPAGVTKDLWHHESGCSSWLVVERNATTHEIHSVTLASEVAK